MSYKSINSRVKHKTDTTANWNAAIGFIPLKGEIIVYSDRYSKTESGVTTYEPGIKIGTGTAYVQDLTFIGDKEAKDLLDHIRNTSIHTSETEKAFWNDKLNVNDEQEVHGETLLFNRN